MANRSVRDAIKVPARSNAEGPAAERQAVVRAITDITNGPRALRLYMELCAKCGTCATVCPIYAGKDDPHYNPSRRSDLIRKIYRRHCTSGGRLFGGLSGARDFVEGELLSEWVESFYSCTGCRRCARFCPLGIDNSVITRKGRAILDQLGLTPDTLRKVVEISLKTRNTDGAPPAALKEAVKFLKEEMRDEHGTEIDIPVDKVGARYFYVPPSGDVLVNIEATMGIAKAFHVLGMGDQWTMSSECFDEANYGFFTGNDDHMRADNKPYVDEAKRLGCEYMLMGECGHGYRVMKMMMEKEAWWGTLPFTVINCMEWTADRIREGRLTFDKSKNPEPVTYHDPCNLSRSCGITEAPRIILEATCEDFREMTPNRTENWCCGGGGGLSRMDDLHEFRMTIAGRKKLEQIRATGARYVATPCANCKRQLTQLMAYHNERIVVGGVHDVLSRAILVDGKAAERTEL
jgi:Fe-S oxidoreductase